MSDLVKFSFQGDELDVIPEAGDAWIAVRRICEVLGVDESRQRRKLAANPAASTALVSAIAEDGAAREMFCVSVRSLPLWLATIHPGRVREDVREKLVAYQRQAGEVLAEHFLGPRARALPSIDTRLALLADEVAQLRGLAATAGLITGLQQDHIKTRVDLLAHKKHALGHERSVPAARTKIQNMLRTAAGWGGTGELRRFMPATSYPHVCAALHALEVELDRETRRRRLATAERPDRQPGLFQ